MRYIPSIVKKIIAGLGLLALTSTSLSAQNNPLKVKAGIAYNIVQTNEISKNCLGIETLLEKKVGNVERLSGEWEVGLYADTRTTSEQVYSKMQTNFGLKYKPIFNNGWSVGGKLALGVSSEFYKQIEGVEACNKVSLNKSFGADFEKEFKSGRGVNLFISKEIDRNIWKIGLKGILRWENKNSYGPYPWPPF